MSYLEDDAELARKLQQEFNANPRRSATRAPTTTSNNKTRPKKQTTSLKLSTPRQLKKLLPKSTKCAESRLSPNDSGFFSEAASAASTDEEVRSEFAPPSKSSSDATLASSVISPTSPEADAEDEVDDEVSLPEVSILILPLAHSDIFALSHVCAGVFMVVTFNNLNNLGHSPESERIPPSLSYRYYRRRGKCHD
jgi:hypothetical protein